ncbi:MAG: zinc-ribbon domain-containing protein [Desulfuromonadales bacterium]|nr:zinc-ribbon domain-containing protein [Desulfuromonadales bacterium]
MVIECSSCHARFKLADDKIKENGTKVRCTKCREVFTVFPESSLPVAPPEAPPMMAAAPAPPVVTPPQEQEEETFFSVPIPPSLTTEMPSPAPDIDLPVQENQDIADDLFSAGFTDESGDTDLDSIRFDNTEAPIFSVSQENEEKFDFADELAISFTDSSPGNTTDESSNISEADNTQFFPGESASDFEADYTSAPVRDVDASEDLNTFDTVSTDSEFSFSPGGALDDLSWDEPEPAPMTATPSEPTVGTGMSAQDKSFDFNSFSFDEVEASAEAEKKTSAEEVAAQNDATIELATGDDSSSVPLESMHSSGNEESLPLPLARERKESPPRVTRPLRPRVRPKKKSSSRLIIKIIMVILLALTVAYGFMYRDQIEKTYTHLVNRFIEKQTLVETSGSIGLVKLSGSYIHNSLEGELFVIHGEVVNEFKGLRSSVLVKGTIFGDNEVALQSQSAYSGNPLKESSLKSLSIKEIRNAMSNELGENLVNLNIAPGKAIPFTIVFDKAPKNIKEFNVEVLESKPGSK